MEQVVISTEIAITFVAYSALMLYIGFYFYKKNKNTEDYFLGNRSLGPVISALSAGASDMSGWLLMGLPGALYVSGLVESYIAIGLSIGALLNWSLVAKRLRLYTGKVKECITIPDYFESRFQDDKHVLRVVCALVILVFFTFYVSSGLVAGAKLFEATFGIEYSYALTTGTLIIVIYTYLGGYKAVCWTDMIQGLLMMLALITVPIVMLYHIGGLDETYKYVSNSDEAKKELVEFQKQIPELSTKLTQDLNGVKAELEAFASNLRKTQDKSLSIKDINTNNQDLSTLANYKEIVELFDGDTSKFIFFKDIATKLENALNQADVAQINSILSAFASIELKTSDRLAMTSNISLLAVISALAWGLGYFGQPHIVIRFMSIRSTKDIPTATFVGISWMVISLIGACFIGILGVAYANKFELSLQDPEKIFIVMSQLLFNPWITGILLSAILAAIMSTASSQLLVSSSTIAEDFYKRIFNKEAESQTVMRLGRFGVLLVAVVAFLISTDKNSSVLSIVAYAWAGFGSAFGPVMLISLFWSRMSRAGAISGMIVGAVMVVLYKNVLADALNFHIYEIVPGFLCATLTIIIVSLLKEDKKSEKEFEVISKNL
ncbi:sodium/proline symporter [Campylobacter avium LMG 24591]|uniref:Sodium/proline symporter n=1 Tax=Campylobacter avium LMG 24591 TaxID=522484 RepID=A0A222MUN3_9BACT|nr:sodium:proline symporter [Campylobacter avium]ASQ29767.1 sodium/proline symporter [Campylobacter avium LMG 24591]OYD78866.1 sodium/proline symporter [Campylobacter avium]